MEADLSGANLKWAKLWDAKLIGANLYGVIVDEETRFDFANLTCANLNGTYLHRSVTLRESKIFNYCKKDIYELTGDYVKNREFCSRLGSLRENILDKVSKIRRSRFNLMILDVDKIQKKDSELAKKLYNEGLVRYLTKIEANNAVDFPIIFFDKNSKRAVRIPELENIEEIKREIRDFENFVDIPELKNYIEDTFSEDKKFLYNVSSSIYSILYNFLISSGKVNDALKAHFRENETYRKLSKNEGNFVSYCIHTILRYLTGYGVEIKGPLLFLSLLFIIKLYKSLYEFISKFIGPSFLSIWKIAEPYLILSVNLLITIIESLEAFILALAIFAITYRISR